MASGIEDLIVTVGGDISALQTAFDQIPAAAETASQGVASALAPLNSQLSLLDESVGNFGTEVNGQMGLFSEWAGAVDPVASSLDKLGSATEQAGAAAETAGGKLSDLKPAVEGVGESAQHAGDGLEGFIKNLAALAAALELLHGASELVKTSLESFGEIQKAEIAFTALTGSAETAREEIEKLKEFSISDALSFPAVVQAEQRMIALEIPLSQIPSLLQSAANSAAAMNADFGTAVNMLDRFIAGGTIMARSVASLGINMGDLAKAMGTTTAAATATFKALDQEDRVTVLNTALAKLNGTAEATAKGISGAWTNLGTQMHFVFEDIGKAIAPVAEQFIGLVNAILPMIKTLVEGFAALPLPVKDAIAVIGVLALTIPPVVIAFETLTKAMAAMGAISEITTLLKGNAVALEAEGVAAGSAATGVSAASVAMTALGTAVVVAGAAFAGFKLGEWLNSLEDGNEKLHVFLEAFRSAVDTIIPGAAAMRDGLREWADTVTITATATQLAYINMASQVDGLTISQRALTKEFDQQKIALQSATDKLREATDLYSRGLISLGQLENAQKAVNDALNAMDPAAQRAADAAAKEQQAIDKLLGTIDKLSSHIPQSMSALNTSIAEGGKTAEQLFSQVNTEIQKLEDKMNEIGGATQPMLLAFGKLQQLHDALSQAIDGNGAAYNKLILQMNGFVGPIQEASAGIEVWNGSVKTLSASLATATLSIADATGKIPALTGAIIDSGSAADQAEHNFRIWTGDLQDLPVAANAAGAAIEVLRGHTSALTTDTKAASAAQTELGTVFQTTAEKAAEASAKIAVSMKSAASEIESMSQQSVSAFHDVIAAMNQWSNIFDVTGFGSGPGGATASGGTIFGKPGDVITQRGMSGEIINQTTIGFQQLADAAGAAYQAKLDALKNAQPVGSTPGTTPGAGQANIEALLAQVNADLAQIASMTDAGNATQADMAAVQAQLLAAQTALATALNVPLASITGAVNAAVTATNATGLAVTQAVNSTTAAVNASTSLIVNAVGTVAVAAQTLSSNSTELLAVLGSALKPPPVPVPYSPGYNTMVMGSPLGSMQQNLQNPGPGPNYLPPININVYGGDVNAAANQLIGLLQQKGFKVS